MLIFAAPENLFPNSAFSEKNYSDEISMIAEHKPE
jgi:hypothetical protein